MTRGEIKTEVLRRLREVSSSAVFWSTNDIEIAVDEGYAEMSDASEWFETFDTITLPRAMPYFDIRQFTTHQFLVAGPAYNSTTSRWLTPETARTMDGGDRQWEERLAEPEFILVRGLWNITYWPYTPRAIKQYYKAIPANFTADSAEPGFPEQFHYGIVEYALWDLWAQDGEVDLAWKSWREYGEYESRLRAYVDGRASVPAVKGHSADRQG